MAITPLMRGVRTAVAAKRRWTNSLEDTTCAAPAPSDQTYANGQRKGLDQLIENSDGSKSAREASVRVRDHGPGIAPEHLPRLTERFYRVDVTESRAQGGTGLGLALVKHILNRHGGRLTIESVAGQGATFTAHLPATET